MKSILQIAGGILLAMFILWAFWFLFAMAMMKVVNNGVSEIGEHQHQQLIERQRIRLEKHEAIKKEKASVAVKKEKRDIETLRKQYMARQNKRDMHTAFDIQFKPSEKCKQVYMNDLNVRCIDERNRAKREFIKNYQIHE